MEHRTKYWTHPKQSASSSSHICSLKALNLDHASPSPHQHNRAQDSENFSHFACSATEQICFTNICIVDLRRVTDTQYKNKVFLCVL